MTSPIQATGGAGTLDRLAVPRRAKGEGTDAAVQGAGIIVHLAAAVKGDEDTARNLVRAASRPRPRHLVYISVVGTDRIPVVSGIDRAAFACPAARGDFHEHAGPSCRERA